MATITEAAAHVLQQRDQLLLEHSQESPARKFCAEPSFPWALWGPTRNRYVSWLLVHYLMTVRGAEFANFQSNLADGLSDAEAWSRAFPGLLGVALDHAVQEYAEAGVYEHYSYDLERPEVDTSINALSPADEHALRALLRMTCSKCPERVRGQWRQDAQLALSSDPSNVRAVALAVMDESHDGELALARARALVRARPEDWLAWVALGFAALRAGKYAELVSQPGADPGAHAPLLAPSQPYALLMAALSHATRGEREAAIQVSAAAERMQPTNAALLVARAELLVQLSACAALRELTARIEQMAHADLDQAARQRVLAQSASCKEPAF